MFPWSTSFHDLRPKRYLIVEKWLCLPTALGCQLWEAENSVRRRFLAALTLAKFLTYAASITVTEQNCSLWNGRGKPTLWVIYVICGVRYAALASAGLSWWLNDARSSNAACVQVRASSSRPCLSSSVLA